jgi:agmatine/peptidylarginine deiminase
MPVFACQPGDFEQQSAIMLGCNELIGHHPQVLVEMVSILVDRVPLVAIVNNEEQRRNMVTLLCDWGLPAHQMHYVSLPVKGMWIRDYGPSFVRRQSEGIVINDAEYVETDRVNDDMAPTELANLLKLPVVKVPLLAEGGNILSNGQGICVTTDALFLRNKDRGRGKPEVERILREYYGFQQIVELSALTTEPTGHVDMFATFVCPDTILLGQYDPGIDPVNADVLDGNAVILEKIRTRTGPLKVVRIPMPFNRGGVWRTYTNVIYANDIVIVPTYAHMDPEIERRAMATYAEHLPAWEIMGIDASAIIRQRGSLRCISINIPWLEDRFSRLNAGARRSEIRTSYTPTKAH